MSTYVIAGYVDDDDGTLYWNNDDGWGFLSTATVFTEDDKAEGSLPIGDDARWVALPDGGFIDPLLHPDPAERYTDPGEAWQ